MSEISEILKNATARPWCISRDPRTGYEWNNHIVRKNGQNIEVCAMFHDFLPDNVQGEANAALIVEAVNNYESLQSELAALRERVKELEKFNDPTPVDHDFLVPMCSEISEQRWYYHLKQRTEGNCEIVLIRCSAGWNVRIQDEHTAVSVGVITTRGDLLGLVHFLTRGE